MARYNNARPVKRGGRLVMGSASQCAIIRQLVRNGRITTAIHVVRAGERLDTIAANVYGDATMWWLIAAASGIGWQCQVPVGTILNIPPRDVARELY